MLGTCLLPAVALADTTPAPPDRRTQPLNDGCQRNPAGLLTFTSAHWVFVYRDTTPRIAEGLATDTHVAAGDLPQGHDWYDLNADIALPADQRYLTGINGGSSLHVERESGKVPTSTWPTERDVEKLWGSWAWDCGHWGNDNINPDFFLPGTGQIPFDKALCDRCGESTEFHPWRAIALRRHNPARPQVGEGEADAFITSDGTLAGAENNCALRNPPPTQNPPLAYPPSFTACTLDSANHYQPANLNDYDFFVPAPPKPAPNARLRYRVVADPAWNGVAPGEQVQPQANGIQVHVPFKGFGSAGQAQAFAKSFFVGWDGPIQRLPGRVEVQVDSFKVIHSLDPNPHDELPYTSSGVPPGEYNVYLDVNGLWNFVNDWAPGLGAVLDGQSFAVNRTLGVNVPEGGALSVRVQTRECDLPKINPCPATAEVAEDNDNPGDGSDSFATIDAAVGRHVMRSTTGDWEMAYTVRKVASAHTGPASQAPPPGGLLPAGVTTLGTRQVCFDARSPISRFLRDRLHPTRQGILLRGRAFDLGCRPRAGLRSVGVAVARRSGRRCRFLSRRGTLGRALPCVPTDYLRPAGRGSWQLAVGPLRRGRYVAWVRGIDGAGNVELPTGEGVLRFRVG